MGHFQHLGGLLHFSLCEGGKTIGVVGLEEPRVELDCELKFPLGLPVLLSPEGIASCHMGLCKVGVQLDRPSTRLLRLGQILVRALVVGPDLGVGIRQSGVGCGKLRVELDGI